MKVSPSLKSRLSHPSPSGTRASPATSGHCSSNKHRTSGASIESSASGLEDGGIARSTAAACRPFNTDGASVRRLEGERTAPGECVTYFRSRFKQERSRAAFPWRVTAPDDGRRQVLSYAEGYGLFPSMRPEADEFVNARPRLRHRGLAAIVPSTAIKLLGQDD